MKTNKHLTLLLVKKQASLHSRDLVSQFSYSAGTARSYLSHLAKQGLLFRMGSGYGLTEKGEDRLQYFDIAGCSDVRCPRCVSKSGFLTCPRCGNKILRRDARILPEKDFLFAVRHRGVYCPRCLSPMFTAEQAQLLEIPEER